MAASPQQNVAQKMDLAKSLNFDSEKILQDFEDMVVCYCARGFDAYDKQLLNSTVFSKDQAQDALQGSLQIYGLVLEQLQQGFRSFKKRAHATSMSIPQIVAPALEPQTADPVPEGEEERLDEALQKVRNEIKSAQIAKRGYQMEANMLRQELDLAGDTGRFSSLASTLTANKENLGGDMAAIAKYTQELRPAIERAQAILSRNAQKKAGNPSTNAAILEKEVNARKQASHGMTTDSLSQLRQILAVNNN